MKELNFSKNPAPSFLFQTDTWKFNGFCVRLLQDITGKQWLKVWIAHGVQIGLAVPSKGTTSYHRVAITCPFCQRRSDHLHWRLLVTRKNGGSKCVCGAKLGQKSATGYAQIDQENDCHAKILASKPQNSQLQPL